jgi:tetratricopeptide (TPR) repeat protein
MLEADSSASLEEEEESSALDIAATEASSTAGAQEYDLSSEESEAAAVQQPHFTYHPIKLQDSALDASWFERNPLPSEEEMERLDDGEYDLMEVLYQSAKCSVILEAALTHILDLCTFVHERGRHYDFAMECALLAFDLDPQSALAESKVQRLLDRVEDDLFERARMALTVRDSTYQHHIGHLLYNEGRREEALEMWAKQPTHEANIEGGL